jgi:prophage regulatory protein
MEANSATPATHHAHETYAAPRLLRLPAVEAATGLRRSSIYDLIRARQFPAPVKLSRLSAWPESEVSAWIADRIRERDAGVQP